MILLVDAGNSFCKWCLIEAPVRVGYIKPTCTTYDEWSKQCRILAADRQLAHIYIASVNAEDKVLAALQQYFPLAEIHTAVSEQCFGPLSNGYDNPAQLGVDRWLAMIAATQLKPAHLMGVVSIGTAVTIDLINHEGLHLGGLILPGKHLTLQSLQQNTQKIKVKQMDIDPLFESELLGKNTDSCVLLGYSNGIEAHMYYLSQQFKDPVEWIITGGGAGDYRSRLIQSCYFENLVLIGLAYRYGLTAKD